MPDPLVSIIIPCFRQAHFLAGAVETALAQVGLPVEVIVVNDGSDDETESVAGSFGQAIRYIKQSNAGLPAARNTGITHASGKYLLFLDADDKLHPRCAQWLTEAADGRDDALCVIGYREFHHDGQEQDPSRKTKLPPTDVVLEHYMLRENLASPNAYLSSRAMMNQIGCFDEALRSCEDWDAWLRLIFAGARIVPIRRVGAFYRRHPQSMSKNLERMARTRLVVMNRTLQRLRSDSGQLKMSRSEQRAAISGLFEEIAETHHDCAYSLRRSGQFSASVQQYLLCAWHGQLLTGLLGACKMPLFALGFIGNGANPSDAAVA